MPLPDGYLLRHPTEADLPSAQAVLDAAESHDTGERRTHENELATDWRDPQSDPASDGCVVGPPGGVVAGVAWVWPDTAGEVTADLCVHLEHRGRGVGDALLDTIESRVSELQARRADGAPRRLVVWCEDGDSVRSAALDGRGFVPARQYFEMATDVALDWPPAPVPEGIELRPFRPAIDGRRVWEVDIATFAEHHLFHARGYDEWRLRHLETGDSDPTLWWLAWGGDDLLGYVIPGIGDMDAVIHDLAVRKPWRGRGIGRSLLAAAFATLRDRGQSVVRLYADAQSVTDAMRVYEAAGMHVARRFDVLEKPLA